MAVQSLVPSGSALYTDGVAFTPTGGTVAAVLGDNDNGTYIEANLGISGYAVLVIGLSSWTKLTNYKILSIAVGYFGNQTAATNHQVDICIKSNTGLAFAPLHAGTPQSLSTAPLIGTGGDGPFSVADLTQEQIDNLCVCLSVQGSGIPRFQQVTVQITYDPIISIPRTVILNPNSVVSDTWATTGPSASNVLDAIGNKVYKNLEIGYPFSDSLGYLASANSVGKKFRVGLTSFTFVNDQVDTVSLVFNWATILGTDCEITCRLKDVADTSGYYDEQIVTISGGSGSEALAFTVPNLSQTQLNNLEVEVEMTARTGSTTFILDSNFWIEVVTELAPISVGNAIGFHGAATGAAIRNLAGGVAFHGTTSNSPSREVDAEAGFSQDVEAEIVKEFEHTAGFAQDVDITIIANRTLTGQAAFGQAVGAYVSGRPGCDDYDPATGTSATFVLEYPAVAPTSTVTLRPPMFGDVLTLNVSLKVKRTQQGFPLVMRQTSQPKIERMQYKFEALTKTQIDALIVFHDTSAGKEIKLTDHEGVEWTGIIETPELTTSQTGRGAQFATEFTFRGMRS